MSNEKRLADEVTYLSRERGDALAALAKVRAERDMLLAALKEVVANGHFERCLSMMLHRGCTCHLEDVVTALAGVKP